MAGAPSPGLCALHLQREEGGDERGRRVRVDPRGHAVVEGGRRPTRLARSPSCHERSGRRAWRARAKKGGVTPPSHDPARASRGRHLGSALGSRARVGVAGWDAGLRPLQLGVELADGEDEGDRAGAVQVEHPRDGERRVARAARESALLQQLVEGARHALHEQQRVAHHRAAVVLLRRVRGGWRRRVRVRVPRRAHVHRVHGAARAQHDASHLEAAVRRRQLERLHAEDGGEEDGEDGLRGLQQHRIERRHVLQRHHEELLPDVHAEHAQQHEDANVLLPRPDEAVLDAARAEEDERAAHVTQEGKYHRVHVVRRRKRRLDDDRVAGKRRRDGNHRQHEAGVADEAGAHRRCKFGRHLNLGRRGAEPGRREPP
eukprot:2894270-Prymnesium_polylepis.1